ncbi:Ion channel [Solidesulfovibrio sp. C21]|uniref:Ion channel n=1 Tax=Solidesulfovibrio sp. C21 TaxID=3398613 RepID=UPI0039FDB9C5
MSLRSILGLVGLAVSLPFLIYLVYLSQAKTTTPDQVIFLAFAFSITFPTLILLSLVLFRSLVVLAVSLPVYAACVVAGYARTFMAFQIVCNNRLTESFRDCLYLSVSLFTNTGCTDCIPTPSLRLLAASEAFFGYLTLGVFSACLIVILVRLITANNLR